ncbi:hypothetical protein JIG36_07185 [Actinoplanes sp. LDG1-06]|uniref:Uncharacterized protein n=1 Tax=Paractinoplanes ovalisporus TaxID=2810368 RepID=A0ABS2A665_9ACTN|nr:hypothetical protein [Actinoplanes ovalisporus]MBM2615345.1 hypothetical protein [Actinoplanes ovalisporus]
MGARQGIRELVQVTGMWLGFGEPDTEADPAPRTGPAFLLVQTMAAIALAALGGASTPH